MPKLPSSTRKCRKPIQKRARQRVEQIFDAARVLVHEGGVDAVTTTRIAARAGLPVGSIYQYFPDRTAILASLYEDYLAHIRTVLVEFESNGPYADGWEVYLGGLFRRIKRAEARGGLEIELLVGSQRIAELSRLDGQHAEVVAASLARILRKLGSRWTIARLHRLALFVYRLNYATLVHRQIDRAGARESERLGVIAVLAVLESCRPKSRV